ncbi:MAG: hypothetical protein Q4G48_08625 [Bacteroidia bacterium]|nr:hypothetical protein [Bacteroidia bacterium]
MDKKLIYSVGGHLFGIETPDKVIISDILSNYTPFSEILQRVPVYRLDCRPDYEAVSLTNALLP